MSVKKGYDKRFARNNSLDAFNPSVPCVVICPGYHGHAIARSLGRLGVPAYGVHGDSKSPAARSRYWRENFYWDLSKATPEDSVEWFLRLGSKIGARSILIPTDDHSSLFVDDHAEALQQEYKFPVRPADLTHSLANKQLLYSLCKQHSFPTPETVFPQSRKDVAEFISHATFPVVLKGIDTVALQKRTGVRMVIIHDAQTLLNCYDKLETSEAPSLMIQEYIPGGTEDVWMFEGYFDEKSNCLFEITGRKLRQYPAYTGMTSLGICCKNETVSKQTRDFMKSIGYRGILDIGYKYDARTGKYYLLDPNPRIGATFRLFVDTNGTDAIRALFRDLTGQPVPAGAIREGRKWLFENFDVISSLRYWRDGKLSLWDWIRSFRGVEEAQWFALDDLRPFGTVLLRSFEWVVGVSPKNVKSLT